MQKSTSIVTIIFLSIFMAACGESSSPTSDENMENSVDHDISARSSSSFIQDVMNSSSSIQNFIYSSSDPAQNIHATSGFFVRFVANIDGVSGWMPNQTFFPEIPQYLEKNKYKRNYCSFQGWALSSEGEVVYKDGASVIVSSNVDLYAKWYCREPSFISSSSFSLSSTTYLSSSSIAYGQLTDDRDGKVYKTVVIGRQTWMAENLDYDYRSYGCRHDSCSVFGRFYSWSSAMDSVAKFSKNGAGCGVKKSCSPTYPVRGICPNGWHLPTRTEFETMLNFVGTDRKSRSEALRITGNEMYARGIRNDYGWEGNNSYGFSIIRTSGDIESDRMYYELYASAYFWASTDPEGDENWQDSDVADCLSVIISSAVVGTCLKYKYVGMSVRCVKDSE